MEFREERLLILEMIEKGRISPQEGMRLLQDLGGEGEEQSPLSAAAGASAGEDLLLSPETKSGSGPDPEDLNQWKKWWVIPLGIGAAITILGSSLMYWVYTARGIGFLFFLTWIPFLLGIGTLILAWQSQTSPWLHLRIHQAPGEKPEKIALSIPIPIHFTAWFLRTFGRWIPNIDSTGLDEVILALGKTANEETPLSITVHEGDDSERVQVYIG